MRRAVNQRTRDLFSLMTAFAPTAIANFVGFDVGTLQQEPNMSLNKREQKAIDALNEVAKIWPESLWIFSANGSLFVMKKKAGERMMAGESVDQNYIVERIDIENDGGDF